MGDKEFLIAAGIEESVGEQRQVAEALVVVDRRGKAADAGVVGRQPGGVEARGPERVAGDLPEQIGLGLALQALGGVGRLMLLAIAPDLERLLGLAGVLVDQVAQGGRLVVRAPHPEVGRLTDGAGGEKGGGFRSSARIAATATVAGIEGHRERGTTTAPARRRRASLGLGLGRLDRAGRPRA